MRRLRLALRGAAGTELVPTFSGKWLLEGKTQYPGLLAMGGRKYQIHGNIIRPAEESAEPGHGYMGIAYWVDVTEYDDIRIKYEETRPVIATIVIDNYDELVKNHPDRIKNDLRDAVEDSISQWCDGKDGFPETLRQGQVRLHIRGALAWRP